MNTIGFLTADEAEVAFYQAFEKNDLQQMMRVWAAEDSIVCIHPMGVINHGLDAVKQGWQQIFKSAEKMHFEINVEQRQISENITVHIVTETIYVHGDQKPRPSILATNIYQHYANGWHMVLHHASPSVINTTPTSKVIEHNKFLH